MNSIIFPICSFLLVIVLVFLVKKIAFKFDILDRPNNARKKHAQPIALLGGVALWISFWLVVGYVALSTDVLTRSIHMDQLLGMFVGSLLLIILGVLDEKYSLSPYIRLPITALAMIVVIVGGVGLGEITNPLGGSINLRVWPIGIEAMNKIFVLGDIVVFFWLMGILYTTKILDGLDGLATGITLIGALMIFFLTQTAKFYQPEVGLLALIFAGCCLGFLMFNFYPATIFLGESGSLFIGFMLGVLAVISGGKIATTLLVMAVPILDLVRVVMKRIFTGKKIFEGDREHLHFRLLDHGFTQRKIVVLLYAISFLFGMTTLILPSTYKLVVLFLLALGMLGVSFWLRSKSNNLTITNNL